MTDATITSSEKTVDDGIKTVSDELDAALKASPPDASLVLSLSGLRGRYVLDRMQLTRAEILKIDNSDPMKKAISDLNTAQKSLSAIQSKSAGTTAWINSASGGLDTLMDALNKVKALAQ
jgi:hypothetical protein